LWDQNLDVLSFLEKALLPNKAKEKLMGLKEDRLVQETMRQLAKALLTEKSKEALGSTEEKMKLLAEVERLKEELTQKDDELAKEKEGCCQLIPCGI